MHPLTMCSRIWSHCAVPWLERNACSLASTAASTSIFSSLFGVFVMDVNGTSIALQSIACSPINPATALTIGVG